MIAFLFPGQGSQRIGMGQDLCREFALARETFAEADDVLGESLSRICFTGPEEALTLTENTQPALLVSSIATARVLAQEGVVCAVAAGHSLGEWSALVCMESIEFADALRAVRQRGRFMQEAVAPGVGAMSALLGADLAAAEELCRVASRDGAGGEIVVPANVNGAGQVVVSGHAAAVARLEALAAGRKVRAMRLKVSAPFHSPLMAPARERMEELLRGIELREARGTVLSNVDAQPYGGADDVRARLCAQITSAVRWEDCARGIASRAASGIEVGSGKVLTGLMRRIAPSFPCTATDDAAAVRAARASLTA